MTDNSGRMTHAQRRAARQDRLDARADRLRAEATSQFNRSAAAIEGIPFGQPILVGHHSEKRHRRDLARSRAAMDKSVAATRAADQIAAIEPSTAVLVTDADGPEILRARLARAEERQTAMKAVNVMVRKNDRAGLAAAGYSPGAIEELFKPQWGGTRGPIGIPAYALSNNSANIRRMKARLAELDAIAKLTSKERMFGDVRVEEDADAMRIRLHFPGKPASDVIARLKANGFRWAPSERAWQRQLNPAGRWAAERVLKPAIDAQGRASDAPEG